MTDILTEAELEHVRRLLLAFVEDDVVSVSAEQRQGWLNALRDGEGFRRRNAHRSVSDILNAVEARVAKRP